MFFTKKEIMQLDTNIVNIEENKDIKIFLVTNNNRRKFKENNPYYEQFKEDFNKYKYLYFSTGKESVISCLDDKQEVDEESIVSAYMNISQSKTEYKQAEVTTFSTSKSYTIDLVNGTIAEFPKFKRCIVVAILANSIEDILYSLLGLVKGLKEKDIKLFLASLTFVHFFSNSEYNHTGPYDVESTFKKIHHIIKNWGDKKNE